MSAVVDLQGRGSDAQEIAADLMLRARVAQKDFADADQSRVDEAVRAIAWSLYKPEHAKALAELAVEDTGLGNVPDKIIKKQRKTFGALRDLLRVKSVGEIERDDKRGIVKFAKPIGVIGAITPSTNPGATPVNKALLAIKGGASLAEAVNPNRMYLAGFSEVFANPTLAVLATALFVGAAGVFGFFGWIFAVLPRAAVFPILVFVGLEITSQSFRATPRRHFPALVLACVPALAYLAYLMVDRFAGTVDQVFGGGQPTFGRLGPEIQHWIQTITVLAGGFIVTSLLWGTALARVIDGKMRAAAATLLMAGALALVGVIHSPLRSGPILWPWEAVARLREQGRLAASAWQTPYHWAGAYALMAGVVLFIGRFGRPSDPEETPGSEVP